MRTRKLTAMFAVPCLALCLATFATPTQAAVITLIDNSPTTVDGGFEDASDWTVSGVVGFSQVFGLGARTGTNTALTNENSQGTFTSDDIAQTVASGDTFNYDLWMNTNAASGTFDVEVYLVLDNVTTALLDTFTHNGTTYANFSGSHKSSSSRKAIHSPCAAANARLRPTLGRPVCSC